MAGLNPLVFLDIAVGRRAVGRLKFELFHDQLPFTSENFRCLCTGETGLGYWLRPRWYRDTNTRVVPGFMCQGGDFNFGSALMGESIYGQKFRDERFCYKHSKRGVLSMANVGRRHTNNSQFFITFAPCPWLDGKHVVFGHVVEGMEVLDVMEASGTEGGKTSTTVGRRLTSFSEKRRWSQASRRTLRSRPELLWRLRQLQCARWSDQKLLTTLTRCHQYQTRFGRRQRRSATMCCESENVRSRISQYQSAFSFGLAGQCMQCVPSSEDLGARSFT